MKNFPFNVEKIISFGPDGIEYLDTFYDDLRVTLGSLFSGGGTAPTAISYKNTYIYGFNVDDQLHFSTQTPHSWKIGTDLILHLHWTPHSRGTSEVGSTVNWRVDLSTASENGVFPSATTYVLTATCDGTNDKHQRVSSTVNVSGTSLGLSSMILGKIYRITGDSWSGASSNAPGLLQVDFHYQIDRPGSRQEWIK